MSRFCQVETQFKNKDALVSALNEMGYTHVEVHDEAQYLYGYQGDVRDDVANIIIRRQYVGGSSNDLGFVKTEDGTYKAVISEYDRHRHNDQWLNKLKCSYGFHVIQRQAQARGRTVTRENLPNGSQRITIGGYR